MSGVRRKRGLRCSWRPLSHSKSVAVARNVSPFAFLLLLLLVLLPLLLLLPTLFPFSLFTLHFSLPPASPHSVPPRAAPRGSRCGAAPARWWPGPPPACCTVR